MSDPIERVDQREVANAGHMDQLTDSDGNRYYVLEYPYRDEQVLVNADVIEYSRINHPALTGLLASIVVVFSILAPPYLLVAYASQLTDSLLAHALTGFTAVILAWAGGNVALNHTAIGDQVYRFLEWNEHKIMIMGRETV